MKKLERLARFGDSVKTSANGNEKKASASKIGEPAVSTAEKYVAIKEYSSLDVCILKRINDSIAHLSAIHLNEIMRYTDENITRLQQRKDRFKDTAAEEKAAEIAAALAKRKARFASSNPEEAEALAKRAKRFAQ